VRAEYLVGAIAVPNGGKLLVLAGERRMTIDWADLKDYRGARAQRGAMLPRGWRSATGLELG
jgi:topoisomerase-4 subunit A